MYAVCVRELVINLYYVRVLRASFISFCFMTSLITSFFIHGIPQGDSKLCFTNRLIIIFFMIVVTFLKTEMTRL